MKIAKIATLLVCLVSFGFSLEVTKDALNYFNQALSYQQSNQIDKAIEYYQKAINADSSFSEAYLNLGSAYLDKGDLANAKLYMQKACSLGNSAGCENYNTLNAN